MRQNIERTGFVRAGATGIGDSVSGRAVEKWQAFTTGNCAYREKLPLWQLLGLAFITLLWIAVVSSQLTHIFDPLLQKALFGWVPDWFVLNTNFAGMSRQALILSLSISLVCTSWVGPVVEELYFRGYLLPRLSRFGNWAPVLITTILK